MSDEQETLDEARRILSAVVLAAMRVVRSRAWTRKVHRARLIEIASASSDERGIYQRAVDLLAKARIVTVDARGFVAPSKRLRKPLGVSWAIGELSNAAVEIGARMAEAEKIASALDPT